jgi:hypothetical protein
MNRRDISDSYSRQHKQLPASFVKISVPVPKIVNPVIFS